LVILSDKLWWCLGLIQKLMTHQVTF
jgi:hypothetical protein